MSIAGYARFGSCDFASPPRSRPGLRQNSIRLALGGIANILGMSMRTAKYWTAHGLERLRAALDGERKKS
jgi:hypothetical protein